ncbi:hypothetical protein NL676_026237 [Syzygium grande]|nr:hypothetical protein NL676_026237 [Syzygium grande]
MEMRRRADRGSCAPFDGADRDAPLARISRRGGAKKGVAVSQRTPTERNRLITTQLISGVVVDSSQRFDLPVTR